LLTVNAEDMVPTLRGRRFLNDLLELFLAAEAGQNSSAPA